jgi:hypothetical protein
VSLVGKEGTGGATESYEEGHSSAFPPIREQGVIRGSGGGDEFPGSSKGRPETRIT